MAITIGNNIASLRAQRQLGRSTDTLGRVNERLSSGQRINRAADDAAGLAIADSLRADRRVFAQGIKNLNDGLSLLNIADSALGELTGVSIRHKELATQSANGILGNAQRQALDEEADALVEEFNRIIETTEFNGRKILRSDFGELRLQAGYGLDGSLAVAIGEPFDTTLGDGTFHAALSIPNGSTVSSYILVGDVDGDLNLDYVSGYYNSDFLAIGVGNGDGTFSAPLFTQAGRDVGNARLVDINEDGLLDIVTANRGSHDTVTLLGQGDGTFSTAITSLAGNGPWDLVVGDFDGDGLGDFATANRYSDDVTVALGNGDGTFSSIVTFQAGSGPQYVSTGDFNGDGQLDLVSSNSYGNDVTFLLGNGDGTFGGRVTILGTFASIAQVVVRDFNGDGFGDIAAADRSLDGVSVFFGNGNATFNAEAFSPAGNGASGLASADFNGDLIPDLVSSNGVSDDLTVLLSNGDGTFSAAVTYEAGNSARGVASGDLNGDGALDLIAANYFEDNLTVNLGNTRNIASAGGIQSLAAMDLTTRTSALAELEVIDTTLNRINSARATIGAAQSRVQTAIRNLQTAAENYAGAESRIRDANVAAEAASATRISILQQAGAAVLSQANQQPAIALQLLGS